MSYEDATPLVQFRAGRTEYKNGLVVPQDGKGTLSVFPAREPTKVLLVWSSADPHVNIMLPKSGVTVKFVEKCTTGRVLLFEESPTQRYFFWLQEKSTANDQEYLKKLKEIFTGSASTGEQNTPQVGLSDFKKLLASISSGAKANLGVADILSSSKLTEVVQADRDFYKNRLSGFLPPGCDGADIISQVQNPQIRAAGERLDAVLREPAAYKEVCKTFGIPVEDGQVGTEAFIAALKKSVKKE